MGVDDKIANEDQSAQFKWDTFFYGPEGYDEHVGIMSDSAEAMTAAREKTIKSLGEIKARPKGGQFSQPREPQPVSADPMLRAAQQTGVAQKVCPIHGETMVVVPPGGTPGVSKHTSRNAPTRPGDTGQYTAYWKCPVQGCKSR